MSKLIVISIPLFLIHAVEEYLTGFYNGDETISFLGTTLGMSPLSIFILLQIFLFAVILVVLLRKSRIRKIGLIVFGLILLLELSHPVSSLIGGQYTPGLYTSVPIIIIGVFYIFLLFRSFTEKSVN